MTTTQPAARIGDTPWHLVEMPTGTGSCDHCGRALKHLYRVVNPDGTHLTVGRGCVKTLTGWTLAAAEAARILRIAHRDAARAKRWARFTTEHPQLARIITADVAAYEQQAPPGSEASASYEIKCLIGDGHNPDDFIPGYLARRPGFWWVR